MNHNESTHIVTIPKEIIERIKSKKAISDLKKLMNGEEILYDEHTDYDEENFDSVDEHRNCDCDKIIDTLVNLCESSGKVKPRETVKKLEDLLDDSDSSLNPCFFNRYILCLACSCNNADESYIQSAVDKLRFIIENIEDSDSPLLIESYISCLSKLSAKQEPAQAKLTIAELKSIGDETNAWENIESLNSYCLALMHLGSHQVDIGDLQGAYQTSQVLESIVNENVYSDNIIMFTCYAVVLDSLCKTGDMSISEIYELTQKLEDLMKHTESLDNVAIAREYISSLYSLVVKQKEQAMCRKKTFERARSVAENSRYDSNDDILDWYVLILVYQMDESSIDSLKLTFSKMEEIASKPQLQENDFFDKHYNYVKELLEVD